MSREYARAYSKKYHSDDKIPLLVSGKNIKNDGTSRFTETYSEKGEIGKILGYKVIERSLQYLYPVIDK